MELIKETKSGFLQILPPEGYKIRAVGDDTQSFSEVDIPIESGADGYIAVPIDEPDVVVEINPEKPTDDDELSDSEALAIITSGGVDDDES